MKVTELARTCGLSRGTILYYESIGLLSPASRSPANYRRYDKRALDRLRQICMYRNAGLKLEDIRELVNQPAGDASAILTRRLAEIDGEIQQLRASQQAIFRLMQLNLTMERTEVMTKDKWVEIMRATGFSEQDMHRWHVQFEKAAPDDHQQFLEFLHIPAEEIGAIRDWSRQGVNP